MKTAAADSNCFGSSANFIPSLLAPSVLLRFAHRFWEGITSRAALAESHSPATQIGHF
jgi:hypothetical protein